MSEQQEPSEVQNYLKKEEREKKKKERDRERKIKREGEEGRDEEKKKEEEEKIKRRKKEKRKELSASGRLLNRSLKRETQTQQEFLDCCHHFTARTLSGFQIVWEGNKS